MRTFNLISSWLLWLLCAFYAQRVIYLRVFDTVAREPILPDKFARYVKMFWLALAMFAACAACAYLIRQRFWFSRQRDAGLGFWVLTVFFYLFVLAATAAGFAPYFAGDRSAIQWASCVLGVAFLALGFPRVPQSPASSSPPLSPDESSKHT
jgi:hypothetical protein